MNRRIKEIIRKKSLTNSAFADLLGIQRSGVSHILSGRNKPSIDFITKLLEKFPEIDAEWLILGKGNMYKISTQSSSPPANVQEKITTKKTKQEISSNNLISGNEGEIEKVILLMKDGRFISYSS